MTHRGPFQPLPFSDSVKNHALDFNFKTSLLHSRLKVVGRHTCSNHIKIRWKRSIAETWLGKIHLGRQSPPVVPESQFQLPLGGLRQEMLVKWAAWLWVPSCRKYCPQSEGSEMAQTQQELSTAGVDLISGFRSSLWRLRARQV